MIRVLNHSYVSVVIDPADYRTVLTLETDGTVDAGTRQGWPKKDFSRQPPMTR